MLGKKIRAPSGNRTYDPPVVGSIPAGSLIKEKKKRLHVSTVDIVALIEQKNRT